MLGGIFPDGLDLVQTARLRRRILGRDRYPMKSHFLGCIGNSGNIAHILQAGDPAHAGMDIDYFHPAAIRSHEDMVAIQ